ncbi:MAG: L-serine ammonia-lyase, iron-sulfur-dependent, subunit alpha [Lachnospiraceae bacterium]|nr:L-serine ammonia-lyase, iron-sulfur-dependent, subunit alpha [Lachnospiraceae bacterium]
MKSIRDLYRIGRGPSSSHTMGPESAVKRVLALFPNADNFTVKLYGSLAKTGKGHQTDVAILKAFEGYNVNIIFDTKNKDIPHPNTLDFVFTNNGVEKTVRAISIGGGAVSFPEFPQEEEKEVYKEKTFSEIAELCNARKMRLSDYVFENEGEDIKLFLAEVWETMKRAIDEGLSVRGVLPGGLNIERKAQYLYNQRHIDESASTKENRIVCSYSFAVAEQNASSGIIVTAPTCGSCGVLPGALRYMQEQKNFKDDAIIRALAVGGLIGNLIKSNASISGAECGCQAEIGSACSMCAAALAELHEMGIAQIEYAAEVAMEHHLGLTCDPINGLVQIPCIERNAVAAMRAINALSLANFLTDTRKISFDMVVKTMKQTGLDMNKRYRETSEGGLAKLKV